MGFGSVFKKAWNAASDFGRKAAAEIAADVNAAKAYALRGGSAVADTVRDTGVAIKNTAVAAKNTAVKAGIAVKNAAVAAGRARSNVAHVAKSGLRSAAKQAYRSARKTFGKKAVRQSAQTCPIFSDIYYDEYGRELTRSATTQGDRHFMIVGDKVLLLDGKPIEPVKGDKPYVIMKAGDLDKTAVEWAKQAKSPPAIFTIPNILILPNLLTGKDILEMPNVAVTPNVLPWILSNSLAGKPLDSKPWLDGKFGERTLWDAGDGMFVHNDKVGNAAWGYYMDTRVGVPESLALFGARLQSTLQAGRTEDSIDQQFIRRGYALP